MTNDQKLVFLIHQVDELLRAEDKADQSGFSVHRDDVKKKRLALKVWLATNKIVSASVDAVRRKASIMKSNTNRNNWLGR